VSYGASRTHSCVPVLEVCMGCNFPNHAFYTGYTLEDSGGKAYRICGGDVEFIHKPIADIVPNEVISKIADEFEKIDALYIADGHHRTASAVKVGRNRRRSNPGYSGEEEFNYFMAVAFPYEQLTILPYHRVVKDLNGKSVAQLNEELVAAKKELFNLRFQNATNQLDNTSRIKEVRRNIARIQTAITQASKAE